MKLINECFRGRGLKPLLFSFAQITRSFMGGNPNEIYGVNDMKEFMNGVIDTVEAFIMMGIVMGLVYTILVPISTIVKSCTNG